MSNQEILEKVFTKVGYDSLSVYFLSTYYSNDLCPIIFHHDFAKAFWGTQEHEYNDNGQCKHCSAMQDFEIHAMGSYCWQEHLCDMVLSEEPLKYLAKYV